MTIEDTTTNQVHISMRDVQEIVDEIARGWINGGLTGVFGVPRGGCTPAGMLATALGIEVLDELPESPKGVLVVDDLVDSGETLRKYWDAGFVVDALYRKSHSPDNLPGGRRTVDGWLVFPWERAGGAQVETVEQNIVRVLQFIGEDPTRDGLINTPARVVRALTELTAGYEADLGEILATQFAEDHNQMIVVKQVPFSSLCEHHMLPFVGHATVGYVPSDGIVGLSKLARVVEAFARRLQVQERMTDQIVDALTEHLKPLGVGVRIEASHSCMSMRGVQRSAQMVTTRLTGVMESDPLRSEFISLS